MKSFEIVVSPLDGGWMVRSSGDLAPLFVRSGGRAEAKAEAIARALAVSGADVRVVIMDRSGALAGTKRFWAPERPDGSQVERSMETA